MIDVAAVARRPTRAFRHEALLYAGDHEFVECSARFIRDGLDAGEIVIVVVNSAKLRLLKEELGEAFDTVHFSDMESVGANPARIIPAWRQFLGERSSGARSLRGIGEPIWASRTADELVECQRHESLLNLAFAGAAAFRLLCPYDTEALAPAVIDEARRSHPMVLESGAAHPSSSYRGLASIAEPFGEPLPEPAAGAIELAFDAEGLAAVRTLVTRQAAHGGMDSARAYDFVLAVNEIASNSIRHGGGGGVLRLWRMSDAIVCEIRDCGCINHPLAGRMRPTCGEGGGWGLWLANQLCDLVQVRTFSDCGVVRLHMHQPVRRS